MDDVGTMREPISKKLRFEIFKRDSFTCQYCGRKAPDILLECDHIKSVAQGGTNDILNLITSCTDCNAGKGARNLTEHATLSKQIAQLSALQERREQIEMMIEWRRGLDTIDADTLEAAATRWGELTGWSLNVVGKDTLRKLIKSRGLDLVLRSMPEALSSYGERDDGEKFTQASVEVAFKRLGGVARVISQSDENPHLRRMFYIVVFYESGWITCMTKKRCD